MIIVVGSRRDGNSQELAHLVQDMLNKDRIYSKIIVPGNQKIHLCTGCMDCDKDGVCDFKDDMEQNIEDIKNDNVIMFITPTRWNLLSGDLKIFMDRLNPLYSKGLLRGKKLIAVSIGSKSRDLYSTESSLSDLISFAEAAKMNVVLDKQFYDCLDFKDILKYQDEISKFLLDIKQIVN